ncbi:hypothetical protein NVP1238A_70 [Vibrio phage 1.238.A._10N.261.52.F10]|uniref:Uncharacterized protein n=1 Tax=Vibrio phage 1.238.A._10N.261.52.F10 TaxID=1881231 RepID=A0A2I7RUK5_9CAUD|nr:hypothetical protein KNT79_gp70 [Vibrio phage 1.238.A._10N.261.52.F10]AUR97319.1 hypothetical protein NVP1238A_70 [Vibrio phage 1.238.A._10N.261.52.F10]AUR97413.1 hypothetical protein NVP1238B_71 [Vibrio phage 1.238.B._10N.261.52.F10]
MSREIKFRVWDKINKVMYEGYKAITLQHQAEEFNTILVKDKNPYRAIAICFLKMKDVER